MPFFHRHYIQDTVLYSQSLSNYSFSHNPRRQIKTFDLGSITLLKCASFLISWWTKYVVSPKERVLLTYVGECLSGWGTKCIPDCYVKTPMYTFRHRFVCIHSLELATPTEGCSLTEWSAALPDLHVKQAALTPPLLHPRLFLMPSSSLHPRPPSQSFLLFPTQSFSGPVWCLDATAAFLTFSLWTHLALVHTAN